MTIEEEMPGEVGSQSRALSHTVSGISPAPYPHYTNFIEDVKLEHDWITEPVPDWAVRSCHDAERAAAGGLGKLAAIYMARLCKLWQSLTGTWEWRRDET